MNTKFKKTLKISAAGLFVVALAINIGVTMTDPFSTVSNDALADTTGSGYGSTSGNNSSSGSSSNSNSGGGIEGSSYNFVVGSQGPYYNPRDISVKCSAIHWTKTVYYGSDGQIIATTLIEGGTLSGGISGNYVSKVTTSGVTQATYRTGRDCPNGWIWCTPNNPCI